MPVREVEKKRIENERKFSHGEKLPNGDRKYGYEIIGKFGYKARYVKEVNRKEETVRFRYRNFNNFSGLLSSKFRQTRYQKSGGSRRVKKSQKG